MVYDDNKHIAILSSSESRKLGVAYIGSQITPCITAISSREMNAAGTSTDRLSRSTINVRVYEARRGMEGIQMLQSQKGGGMHDMEVNGNELEIEPCRFPKPGDS